MNLRLILAWLLVPMTLAGAAWAGSDAPARPAVSPLPHGCLQMVLVLGRDWDAPTGTLALYERFRSDQPWKAAARPFPVSLGRAGLAWGLGLHAPKPGDGPEKREGDGKAPAGVFSLGPAFAARPDELGRTALAVLDATRDLVCVDDPASRAYNTLVEVSSAAKDWRSAEDMRRSDGLYRFGLVVGHNPLGVPEAGSCIFLHIWRGPGQATAGCTAMEQGRLRELIRRLDPIKLPVLVQLPEAEYQRLKQEWQLP